MIPDEPKTVTVTEVARRFAEYINRVAYRGESFLLTRGKKPVAELRPIPRGVKFEEFLDIMARLPHLTKAEAEDFARDLEEARDELDRLGVPDRWES
jgi:antitoxin (DNA-binding transcriptional repressor) of toxin-antitoxin stability system